MIIIMITLFYNLGLMASKQRVAGSSPAGIATSKPATEADLGYNTPTQHRKIHLLLNTSKYAYFHSRFHTVFGENPGSAFLVRGVRL